MFLYLLGTFSSVVSGIMISEAWGRVEQAVPLFLLCEDAYLPKIPDGEDLLVRKAAVIEQGLSSFDLEFEWIFVMCLSCNS